MTPEKLEEYWSKIQPLSNGCWLWIGPREGNGYPRIYQGPRQEQYAHRAAYKYFIGPIVNELDHICRNRSCVNPTHLEDVTRMENVRRGGNAIKTACKNGHPFVEGSYRLEEGRRRCVICKTAYDAIYNKSRKNRREVSDGDA